MRRHANDYAGGDTYPQVRAWMLRLGTDRHDRLVRSIFVDEHSAAIYVEAICPGTRCTFRRMWNNGLGTAKTITLNRRLTETGKLTLGTVLHECAHGRLSQRYRAGLITGGRNKYGVRKGIKPHGEEFGRTYARILREVLD